MKWTCPKCNAVVYGSRTMTEDQIKKMHKCEKEKPVDLKKDTGEPVKKDVPEFEKDSVKKPFEKGFNK